MRHFERYRWWAVRPIVLYLVASGITFAVVGCVRAAEISFSWAGGTKTARYIVLCLMLWEAVRIVSAMLVARSMMERGLVVRVRRTFIVEETNEGRRLRADGREWSASEVRELAIDAVAFSDEDSVLVVHYARVMLLMHDCVLLVSNVISLECAEQEVAKLAEALGHKRKPVSRRLPAMQFSAALWFLFRSFPGVAIYPDCFLVEPFAGFAIVAAPALADALLIAVGVCLRSRRRDELLAGQLLPKDWQPRISPGRPLSKG